MCEQIQKLFYRSAKNFLGLVLDLNLKYILSNIGINHMIQFISFLRPIMLTKMIADGERKYCFCNNITIINDELEQLRKRNKPE